jgi:hypothetical protein
MSRVQPTKKNFIFEEYRAFPQRSGHLWNPLPATLPKPASLPLLALAGKSQSSRVVKESNSNCC